MTFPPPPPSAQSSIASGTDKSSSTRYSRSLQSTWGSSSSQTGIRRGLTPLATHGLSSSSAARPNSRGLQTNSPGDGNSTSSPLTSTFSAILSSARGLQSGRNAQSPTPASSGFAPLQPGLQQPSVGQSFFSPKIRANTPSSGAHLASAAGSVQGGGGSGGGGGGTGPARGVAFSPLLSGNTVNSPTGLGPEKGGSLGAAHTSQSSLAKISIAQVFLLLDSITDKEGREKWDTKAAQIQKVGGILALHSYLRPGAILV